MDQAKKQITELSQNIGKSVRGAATNVGNFAEQCENNTLKVIKGSKSTSPFPDSVLIPVFGDFIYWFGFTGILTGIADSTTIMLRSAIAETRGEQFRNTFQRSARHAGTAGFVGLLVQTSLGGVEVILDHTMKVRKRSRAASQKIRRKRIERVETVTKMAFPIRLPHRPKLSLPGRSQKSTSIDSPDLFL